MTDTAHFFVNSPASSTTYYAKQGYGAIPTSGTAVQGFVRAWSGANGTGSLVAVSSITAIVRNVSLGSDFTFTASSANNANVSHTATNSTDWYIAGGRYSGSGVGSLEFWLSFTGALFVPSISSFSPGVGPAGTVVTITGSHFTGPNSVDFNGTAATSFSVTDDSHISATVPSGATVGPIHVVSGNGTATSSSNYLPGSIYADDGATFQAGVLIYADDGASWQLCEVYVDDGTAWQRVG